MTYNPMWNKLNELKQQQEGAGTAKPPDKVTPPPPNPPAPPRFTPNQSSAPRPGCYAAAAPTGAKLPAGYLNHGYFDDAGHIHKELLVDHAREVARLIGLRQDRAEGIKNAQLRKFYGHVKTAESRMNYRVPFEAVQPKVLELSAFVAEAHGKGKVPLVFKEFMDLNLNCVSDGKSFREGFVKHFQAVVGFFSMFYRE